MIGEAAIQPAGVAGYCDATFADQGLLAWSKPDNSANGAAGSGIKPVIFSAICCPQQLQISGLRTCQHRRDEGDLWPSHPAARECQQEGVEEPPDTAPYGYCMRIGLRRGSGAVQLRTGASRTCYRQKTTLKRRRLPFRQCAKAL